MKSSQDKIFNYYNDNGDKIIIESKNLAAQGKYAQAIALLESIPMEANQAYQKASTITPQIFQKYLAKLCTFQISQSF